MFEKVRNCLKMSYHDVNELSALVVTLVDLFGPICAPLILATSSISPYMFYILDLRVENWLVAYESVLEKVG